jgi:hypothetical protein
MLMKPEEDDSLGEENTNPPSTCRRHGFIMHCLFLNIGFRSMGPTDHTKGLPRETYNRCGLSARDPKQDFTEQELRSLEISEKYYWCWLAASVLSWGMLVNLRDSFFKVDSVDRGQYYISAGVLCGEANIKMEIMGIYGLTKHSRSHAFVE